MLIIHESKTLMFFLNSTISRFETQSIASIKGEEMDVAINDIHNSKVFFERP